MKILISETTKEERQEIAEKALSISLSGANMPSEEVLELVNQYIEGKKELAEITKEVIKKYRKEDRK